MFHLRKILRTLNPEFMGGISWLFSSSTLAIKYAEFMSNKELSGYSLFSAEKYGEIYANLAPICGAFPDRPLFPGDTSNFKIVRPSRVKVVISSRDFIEFVKILEENPQHLAEFVRLALKCKFYRILEIVDRDTVQGLICNYPISIGAYEDEDLYRDLELILRRTERYNPKIFERNLYTIQENMSFVREREFERHKKILEQEVTPFRFDRQHLKNFQVFLKFKKNPYAHYFEYNLSNMRANTHTNLYAFGTNAKAITCIFSFPQYYKCHANAYGIAYRWLKRFKKLNQ